MSDFNHRGRHAKAPAPRRGGLAAVLLSAALVSALAVGGTVAWLTADTEEVVNTFTPAQVSCEVTEAFDGTVKRNVNVKNTSDIDAYVRVKLVTYRVNENGQRIGGTAAIPAFDPGNGWFEQDGCYYYSSPVAAGSSPAGPLIGADGITLTFYTDADGGKQVVEVMAEAIQSVPTSVVAEQWRVTVGTDGRLLEKNAATGDDQGE